MINLAENVICGRGEECPGLLMAVDLMLKCPRLKILCRRVDHVDENLVKEIADVEFEDGVVNWGRIIALFAFGKELAEQHPSKKECIARDIDNFVQNRLLSWMECNGGWMFYNK